MDAFESLIAMLLRHQGYWTMPSFKVELTKEEKRSVGLPSSPRWELDLIAYKGSTNEVLVVECKSYIDSRGVMFRHGKFEPEERYKLFTNGGLRSVVLNRLALQLQATGSCAPSPAIRLCLAAGNIAANSDREGLARHFEANNWGLFDEAWVRRELRAAADKGYENDVAFVVSKLILRGGDHDA
jgi:hypothetical protein